MGSKISNPSKRDVHRDEEEVHDNHEIEEKQLEEKKQDIPPAQNSENPKREACFEDSAPMFDVGRLQKIFAAVGAMLTPSGNFKNGLLQSAAATAIYVRIPKLNGNFLLTCDHAPMDKLSSVKFNYQNGQDPVTIGLTGSNVVVSHDELDYKLISLSREAQERLLVNLIRPLEVDERPVEPKVADIIMVIQHPRGQQKHISNERISYIEGNKFGYKAGTSPGSSGGAIIFKDMLVGQHQESNNIRKANQGIKISVILDDIYAQLSEECCGNMISPSLKMGNVWMMSCSQCGSFVEGVMKNGKIIEHGEDGPEPGIQQSEREIREDLVKQSVHEMLTNAETKHYSRAKLLKTLTKVVSSLRTDKGRMLNTNNEKLEEKILRFGGALRFISAIGFAAHDPFVKYLTWTLPTGETLETFIESIVDIITSFADPEGTPVLRNNSQKTTGTPKSHEFDEFKHNNTPTRRTTTSECVGVLTPNTSNIISDPQIYTLNKNLAPEENNEISFEENIQPDENLDEENTNQFVSAESPQIISEQPSRRVSSGKKGKLVLSDGAMYEGNKESEQGTLTLPDGTVYSGKRVTLPDGTVYTPAD